VRIEHSAHSRGHKIGGRAERRWFRDCSARAHGRSLQHGSSTGICREKGLQRQQDAGGVIRKPFRLEWATEYSEVA